VQIRFSQAALQDVHMFMPSLSNTLLKTNGLLAWYIKTTVHCNENKTAIIKIITENLQNSGSTTCAKLVTQHIHIF
jgi:hypothetical protein